VLVMAQDMVAQQHTGKLAIFLRALCFAHSVVDWETKNYLMG